MISTSGRDAAIILGWFEVDGWGRYYVAVASSSTAVSSKFFFIQRVVHRRVVHAGVLPNAVAGVTGPDALIGNQLVSGSIVASGST
jgi:hypothetical protein